MIKLDHNQIVAYRQLSEKWRLSQQQANAAILDHVIQPLLRVLGIERHISGAGFEYP